MSSDGPPTPDAALASDTAVPPNPNATTSLIVNVSVNTLPKGDFFAELDASGQLWLKPEDLETLQLLYDGKRTMLIGREPYVPLAAVLESRYDFDEKNLHLTFIGKLSVSDKTSIEVFSLHNQPKNLYAPRETSFFLNYGLTSLSADEVGFQTFTGTTKFGARRGDVFLVSDGQYTKTPENEEFVRLQSSATYERRGDLQWFVLGDRFAGSGDLGSAVNIGGVGLSKVYRLDPYFITQPVFDIHGSTQYPLQAEIFIDGGLVNKLTLMPGAFDLKNLYSFSGAHDVVLVLRDPFGTEQRISYPTYFNSTMLRKGLHDYNYHAGFLRERYGLESNEYGKPVFTAFHRYGLTDVLNIGGRAEGGDGLLNAGASAAFLAPRLGAFTLSAARSDENGRKGTAGMFQHSFQKGIFNTNLLWRGYSKGYKTLISPDAETDDQTKSEMSLATGFSMLRLGNISLSYATKETYGGLVTRIMSASYSKGLSKRISMFATASETRQSDEADAYLGIFSGLQINLDGNVRGAVRYSRNNGVSEQSADIQKSPPVGEGFGYRASIGSTDDGMSTTGSFQPAIQYNGRYGIFTADSTFRNYEGDASSSYLLSLSGSLVYAGGFFGVSRPVSDSFAVVSVDKVPNAAVRNNGQEIGTTSSAGFMVVPTLSSYGQNRITLDVTDLSLDYSVSGVNKVLSPSVWSGSCVAFDAIKTQAITGRIVMYDQKGAAPVEYQEAVLPFGMSSATFPTGKGGEFYLETTFPSEPGEDKDQQSCRSIRQRMAAGQRTIKPGNYSGNITHEGMRCTFVITIPESEDMIIDLGEIRCTVQEEAPFNGSVLH